MSKFTTGYLLNSVCKIFLAIQFLVTIDECDNFSPSLRNLTSSKNTGEVFIYGKYGEFRVVCGTRNHRRLPRKNLYVDGEDAKRLG
jgi:hypothetical protein